MLRLVQIATIEYHSVAQLVFEHVEVRAPEFLPLGDDDESVRAVDGTISRIAELQSFLVRINSCRLLHRFGIVGFDFCACCPKSFHQVAARCCSHVVGAGLERQAPERDGLALEVAVVVRLQLLEDALFLPQVDVFNSI